MKIDKLDSNILSCLFDNSRLTLAEIAKKCESTVLSTVRNKIIRLEQSKIINKFSMSFNFDKLGFIPVIIFLKPNKENLPDIISNIALVNYIETENQIILLTHFKTLSNLQKCIFNLQKNGFEPTFSLIKDEQTFTNFNLLINTEDDD